MVPASTEVGVLKVHLSKEDLMAIEVVQVLAIQIREHAERQYADGQSGLARLNAERSSALERVIDLCLANTQDRVN